MSDNNQPRGGKKGRKIGRNEVKCRTYRSRHGNKTGKKIEGTKEHRGCGPLGYYLRSKKG